MEIYLEMIEALHWGQVGPGCTVKFREFRLQNGHQSQLEPLEMRNVECWLPFHLSRNLLSKSAESVRMNVGLLGRFEAISLRKTWIAVG